MRYLLDMPHGLGFATQNLFFIENTNVREKVISLVLSLFLK